jgi:hypothetical protein
MVAHIRTVILIARRNCEAVSLEKRDNEVSRPELASDKVVARNADCITSPDHPLHTFQCERLRAFDIHLEKTDSVYAMPFTQIVEFHPFDCFNTTTRGPLQPNCIELVILLVLGKDWTGFVHHCAPTQGDVGKAVPLHCFFEQSEGLRVRLDRNDPTLLTNCAGECHRFGSAPSSHVDDHIARAWSIEVKPEVCASLNSTLVSASMHEFEARPRSDEVVAESLNPDPIVEHLRGLIGFEPREPGR